MKKEKLEYQAEVCEVGNGEYKYYINFNDSHHKCRRQEVSKLIFLQFFGKHKIKINDNIKHYYISYNDRCQYEVDKEQFKQFFSFDSEIIKTNNINSRYIELSELTEFNLYNRLLNKEDNIINIVHKKEVIDELFNSIITLNEIQKRRLIMYFFENMTFEEIAKLEGCTKRAVKSSVDVAKRNLYIMLKKYKF